MEKFLGALQNPSACLTGIIALHAEHYHAVMREAKRMKVEVFQNKVG
jgi:hypothetical protein